MAPLATLSIPGYVVFPLNLMLYTDGESYFRIFPCTILFYSRPNAHASNLQSLRWAHATTCLPVDARLV